MAKKPAKKSEECAHDQWRYKDGEAKLFKKGDKVPAGWNDAP